jgi:hypothetical protein
MNLPGDENGLAVERVLVFEKLGKGELAPDEFAGWLRRHGKILEEH